MSDSSRKFYPRIGLEIHVELNTKSKVFCSCKNDPDEVRPNVNVCPVCMGYPGALPVLNKEAVKSVIKLGLALGSKIADFTEWDRKNYFYPDIPKGYQISQYKHPLIEGGELEGIKITRVHLEEDTARSQHDKGEGSIVDFNRSGVPLMELVTEPVIYDAETAGRFARSLQLLLQYLNIAEANMEKGEMRVEANISVSEDPTIFGTKVEVKNLNSFKSVEKAIASELNRHEEAVLSGEKISQETRGWDDAKGKTFSQRSKEEAHDYRYFPDPDLPKLYIIEISEFNLDELRKTQPELPWERENRYKLLSIKEEGVKQLKNDLVLSKFFDEVINTNPTKDFIVLAANYLTSDLQALAKEDSSVFMNVNPGNFSALIALIFSGKINSRAGKDILAIMAKKGGDANQIAEEANLFQNTDSSFIDQIVTEIISENASVVGEYKAGKETAIQFLIGQAMKKAKGKANPTDLKKAILEKIS